MTRALRVLFVGRHFWPHGTIDSAGYLIQLASSVHRSGVHVEVATPRFSNRWSQRFEFREFLVHRPVVVAKNDWGTGRYIRQFSQWLQTHAVSFDAIVCNGAREESIAAIEAANEINVPCLVRICGRGEESDLAWWSSTRLGRRVVSTLKNADRVLVSCASLHRDLVSRGFDTGKIVRLPLGIGKATISSERNRKTHQRRIQYALAAINSDLFVAPNTPVLLAICPMRRRNSDSGFYLVEKCLELVNRMPDLNIWLVGDGSGRDAIVKRLRGDGLRQTVAIPGSFGSPEDLFAAADCFVQLGDDGMDFFLPTAISAGLPVISCDSPVTREILDFSNVTDEKSDDDVYWFDKNANKGLRRAIETALENLETARVKANSLRAKMQKTNVENKSIEKLIAVLSELPGHDSFGNRRSPSMKTSAQDHSASDQDPSLEAS